VGYDYSTLGENVNLSATCFHVELEQFLASFRVARVCQRQLGFLVLIYRTRSCNGYVNYFGLLNVEITYHKRVVVYLGCVNLFAN